MGKEVRRMGFWKGTGKEGKLREGDAEVEVNRT